MRIEVTVAGLAAGQAATIAAKLGEVVAVLRCELDEIETAVVTDRVKPALTVVGRASTFSFARARRARLASLRPGCKGRTDQKWETMTTQHAGESGRVHG